MGFLLSLRVQFLLALASRTEKYIFVWLRHGEHLPMCYDFSQFFLFAYKTRLSTFCVYEGEKFCFQRVFS